MKHYLFLRGGKAWSFTQHPIIAKKFPTHEVFYGDTGEANDECQKRNGIKPSHKINSNKPEERIHCYYALGAAEVTWVGDYKSLSKSAQRELIAEAEERRYNRTVND
jgi:hypothetical protein